MDILERFLDLKILEYRSVRRRKTASSEVCRVINSVILKNLVAILKRDERRNIVTDSTRRDIYEIVDELESEMSDWRNTVPEFEEIREFIESVKEKVKLIYEGKNIVYGEVVENSNEINGWADMNLWRMDRYFERLLKNKVFNDEPDTKMDDFFKVVKYEGIRLFEGKSLTSMSNYDKNRTFMDAVYWANGVAVTIGVKEYLKGQ